MQSREQITNLLAELAEVSGVLGLHVEAFTKVGVEYWRVWLETSITEYLSPDHDEVENAGACYLLRKAMSDAGYWYSVQAGGFILGIGDYGTGIFWKSDYANETYRTIRAFIECCRHKQQTKEVEE